MKLAVVVSILATTLVVLFMVFTPKSSIPSMPEDPNVGPRAPVDHEIVPGFKPARQPHVHVLASDESPQPGFKQYLFVAPIEATKPNSKEQVTVQDILDAVETANIDCDVRVLSGINVLIFHTNEIDRLGKLLLDLKYIDGFIKEVK